MVQNASRDRRLYIRIAHQIRALIETGEYRPGDRLPPLAQIAQEFQCSRATVREALSSLRGQGLVEFRHGDGTYVRTAMVDMWMEPIDAALLLAAGQVSQMVDLMTAVLAGVASVVAERREDNALARLSQAMFELECANPEGEEFVTAELAFWMTLAELAGNPLMENVVRVLQEGLRSFLRMANHSNTVASIRTCRKMTDAVQSQRAEDAREVVYAYGRVMARAAEEIRQETAGVREGQPTSTQKLGG